MKEEKYGNRHTHTDTYRHTHTYQKIKQKQAVTVFRQIRAYFPDEQSERKKNSKNSSFSSRKVKFMYPLFTYMPGGVIIV